MNLSFFASLQLSTGGPSNLHKLDITNKPFVHLFIIINVKESLQREPLEYLRERSTLQGPPVGPL